MEESKKHYTQWKWPDVHLNDILEQSKTIGIEMKSVLLRC